MNCTTFSGREQAPLFQPTFKCLNHAKWQIIILSKRPRARLILKFLKHMLGRVEQCNGTPQVHHVGGMFMVALTKHCGRGCCLKPTSSDSTYPVIPGV